MKPHVCPKCNGEKTFPIKSAFECVTCGGTGVVWEPNNSRLVKLHNGEKVLPLSPDNKMVSNSCETK